MLLELARKAQVRSLAVVGLAKNAGKTVTLGSLIRQAETAGLALGLTSLGYDGEKVDLLTRLSKPRIFAPAGTLIATAEDTLTRAEASLELLQPTNFVTALGPVMLARVREAGTVEIAGPDSLAEIQSVTNAMLQIGCSLALVDGALDRVGSAAPCVTDAAIIATGASVANTRRRILIKTLHAVTVLTTPLAVGQVHQAFKTFLQSGRVGFWRADQGLRQSQYASLLGQQVNILQELQDASHILVPGALTDSFLHEVLHQKAPKQSLPVLVVPDGTHIFASPEVWQRFHQRGGRVEVLEQANVLAVTVNPTSPTGASFPAKDFARELARGLAPIPVYDLFQNEYQPVTALEYRSQDGGDGYA